MPIGLSDTGFEIETIQELRDRMAASARAAIDPVLDTGDTSVIGQLIGIVAERIREVEVGTRDVYNAFTPGGATGESLVQIALITGTIKLGASKSTATVTVNLNAGVTLPALSQARVPGSADAFEIVADVTNSGGSPANVTAQVQALTTGAVRANAGTLTEIITPVSGWNSITNAEDAVLGREDETDTALRLRRDQELRVQGSSNLDAIVEDVRRVSGVVDASGSENETDATVGSLPPHSFRVVVWDGSPAAATDDAIAQAIWGSKPVGIAAQGATSGTALDRQGNPRTVAFSRATQKPVYLTIYVQIDSTTFPVDGDAQIKQAVSDYGDLSWRVGVDVYLSALYGSIFSISGVVRVQEIRADFTATPVPTLDLVIAEAEIALADTSRIVVIHV